MKQTTQKKVRRAVSHKVRRAKAPLAKTMSVSGARPIRKVDSGSAVGDARGGIRLSKKLYKQGGSRAVVLPKEFTQNLASDDVDIIYTSEEVIIKRPSSNLDSMEDDPRFQVFLTALYEDAMANPGKLHSHADTWREFDALTAGVDIEIDDE